MDGKQRRLFLPFLILLSVLLLASCAPAVPETPETCPAPVNLPLEDDPEVAQTLPTSQPRVATAEAPVSNSPKPVTQPSAEPAPDSVTDTADPEATATSESTDSVPAVTTEATAAAPVTETEPVVEAVPAGPPPEVVAHTPGNTAGVEWTQDIRILFSRPMDRESVESSIAVTPVRNFEIIWYRDGKLIRLVPDEPWVAFDWYTVTIGADTTAADGVPLGEAYSFMFWGEEP